MMAAAALLISFGAGRYSTPTKTVEDVHNVDKEVKKENSESDKNKHVETTIVTVVKPDGTKESTTKIVSDSNAVTKTTDTDKIAKDDTAHKETTRGSSPVTLSVLGAINPFGGPQLLDYGIGVTKPVIGPIAIGIFGFKSGVIGASVGVTF